MPKQRRTWWWAALLVAVLAGGFLIAGAGVGLSFIPFPGKQEFARPSCGKLPSKSAVEEALVNHRDLVARLEKVGEGVNVEVATPCEEDTNQAVIRISYKTKAERDGISSILADQGFGTAVELVKR